MSDFWFGVVVGYVAGLWITALLISAVKRWINGKKEELKVSTQIPKDEVMRKAMWMMAESIHDAGSSPSCPNKDHSCCDPAFIVNEYITKAEKAVGLVYGEKSYSEEVAEIRSITFDALMKRAEQVEELTRSVKRTYDLNLRTLEENYEIQMREDNRVHDLVLRKLKQRAEAAEERCKRLNDAIIWALGYTDFAERKDGQGKYWWRSGLLERCGDALLAERGKGKL